MSSGCVCPVRQLQNGSLSVSKGRKTGAGQSYPKITHVSQGKPACPAYGEEPQVQSWPPAEGPRVLRCQGSDCAHLALLHANTGLKVTLGLDDVQKFQSNRSKPAFLLNLRKSSRCENMVWTECKGVRGAWGQGWLRGWRGQCPSTAGAFLGAGLPVGLPAPSETGRAPGQPGLRNIEPSSPSGPAARNLPAAPSPDKTSF